MSRDGAVRGFADLHNHQCANLGFGGRLVWGSPYGEPERALQPCMPLHGRWGTRDLVGNVLSGLYQGRPVLRHSTDGFPTFSGWPRHDSLSHQTVHADWLERAVRGGLRLLVMLAVNNDWVAHPSLPGVPRVCDDMSAVLAQLQAAHDVEAHVDRQCGGAGQGWYRIVRTPADAQRVMAAGKLAVVLGIEVDHLFGCQHPNDLTAAGVARLVDHYYGLGVRHVLPIHFGNNGFGGGSLETPLVRAVDQPYFSAANPLGTLSMYRVHSEDGRAEGLTYRAGRRNSLGLTGTGRALIEALMARGMVIDINHMSWRSRSDTLDMCEEVGYPVIASHSTFLGSTSDARRHEAALGDDEVDRVRRLRGMVGVILDQDLPPADPGSPAPQPDRATVNRSVTAGAVAAAYSYAVSRMDDLPVGIATDFNGFARLPGPRLRQESRRLASASSDGPPPGRPPAHPVRYPFVSPMGTSMDRSRVGERTFDINADGLAHVGMLPDFIEELMAVGVGASELDSLFGSAQGYVSMWDRAVRAAAPPSR